MLARDSPVVICVDDPHPPYPFAQMQGVATVSDDAQDMLDVATPARCALHERRPRRRVRCRRNDVPGEPVVRVCPTKVITGFDIGD